MTPGIRKGGCDIRLESTVPSGDVRIVLTDGRRCGSTAEAIRESVANAVWDAAPDAVSVDRGGGRRRTRCRTDPPRTHSQIAVGGGS